MTKGTERMRRYEEAMKEGRIPVGRVSGSGKIHIPEVGDIHIAGSGRVSPEEISVSGSCRLPGGLKVGLLKASGSLSVDGGIEAEEMKVSGSASIGGEVKASSISASGSFKVAGGITARSIHLAGSAKIEEGVHSGESLTAHGYISVGGDVEVEGRAELRGHFDIDGRLRAERFEAELRDHSRIDGGVEADYVTILQGKRGRGIVLFGRPLLTWRTKGGRLTTTDIVGRREVHIEHVTCVDVTGGDVHIGEGCEVRGRVRYWGNLEVHPEAKMSHPPERVKPRE